MYLNISLSIIGVLQEKNRNVRPRSPSQTPYKSTKKVCRDMNALISSSSSGRGNRSNSTSLSNPAFTGEREKEYSYNYAVYDDEYDLAMDKVGPLDNERERELNNIYTNMYEIENVFQGAEDLIFSPTAVLRTSHGPSRGGRSS